MWKSRQKSDHAEIFFRQIAQQNFAKFAFTNAWFSIFRGCFWVMWTKYNLKTSIFPWINSK